MKKILAGLLTCAALALAGCNDFERTSFQFLSASKDVVDQAQADYEARTIPHTQQAYDAITKAKEAQTSAVNAMVAYEALKSKKDTSTSSLQSQQQIVIASLAALPPLIASVKALIPAKARLVPYLLWGPVLQAA